MGSIKFKFRNSKNIDDYDFFKFSMFIQSFLNKTFIFKMVSVVYKYFDNYL